MEIHERNVMVSIVCITYNQEKYIKEALESFLMQKTAYEYEILIHDDASTDGTAEIIRRYEMRYPDRIRTVIQKENQYSKNIDIIQEYIIPMAKGKYIALCEGDDYWTDPYKIEKQVKALEKNPNCNICTHTAAIIDGKSGKVIKYIAPSESNTIFPTREVILGGGGFVATNSIMMRKKVFEHIPNFRKVYRLDYSLQIMGSLDGGMLYLADCMSVYRMFAENSWTTRTRYNTALQIEHFRRVIKLLKCLNCDTKKIYNKEIAYLIKKEEYKILLLNGNYRKAIGDEYRTIFKEETMIAKIKIYIKLFFPWINRINMWRYMRNAGKQ